MKYFIERQTPNGAWEPCISGATGTPVWRAPAKEAVDYVEWMTEMGPKFGVGNQEYRVVDERGVVLTGAGSMEDKSLGTAKEETLTMNYMVQWQDKDGNWYLDRDDFHSRIEAFDYMCELDDSDEQTSGYPMAARRVVADDGAIKAHGRYLPVRPAPERAKKKPFWIIAESKPSERYSTLGQACLEARKAWSGDPRYVLQAVCEINCVEAEMGE